MASDWAAVVYLAWFSAATYLAGLTSLRTYFGTRTALTSLRVVAMFNLLLVLIIGLVPTGYYNWMVSAGQEEYTAALPKSPAVCYFSVTVAQSLWKAHRLGFGIHKPGYQYTVSTEDQNILTTLAMQGMMMGVLLLTYSFTVRCVKLFPQASKHFSKSIKNPVRNKTRHTIQVAFHKATKHPLSAELWSDCIVLPILGIYICLGWTVDMYGSMLAEVNFPSIDNELRFD